MICILNIIVERVLHRPVNHLQATTLREESGIHTRSEAREPLIYDHMVNLLQFSKRLTTDTGPRQTHT